MYRPLIVNKLNKTTSRWFNYTDTGLYLLFVDISGILDV
jgi:hypothetical protein